MKKPTWDELFKSSSPKSKPTWDELMDSSGRQAASSPLPEIKSSIPRPNINSGVSLPKAPSLLEPEQQAAYERSSRVISDKLKPKVAEPKNNPSVGQWLGANTKAGIGSFNRSLAATADWVLPDFLTPKPVQKTLDYYKGKGEQYAQEAAKVNEASNTGVVGGIYQGAVSAAPSAALAIMSGGASMAAQAPNAMASAGTLASSIKGAVSTLSKIPTFWLSMARTLGSSYEEAKADGANELQANATAIISSFLNAGVEVSGGPEAFKAGESGIRTWVKSALEEGREEVVQGVIENLTRKAMFAHDAPYASLSDPEAVLNPKRAAQEFAGGAIAGGILGGAQSGIAKLASLPRAGGVESRLKANVEASIPTTQAETPVLRPKGWEGMQSAAEAKKAPAAVGAPDVAQPEAMKAIPRGDVPKVEAPTPIPRGDADLTHGYGKNTVGAAESAFPRVQKVSKFRSNTIENSPMFTDADRALLDMDKSKYDVVGEKQSLSEAKQRLQVDFEGEVVDLPKKAQFDGTDTDTAMGILEQYRQAAAGKPKDSPEAQRLIQWVKMIQEKGTEAGQRIQAFAKYSRTPEGAAVKAQKAVSDAWDKFKKSDPNKATAMEDIAEALEKIARDYEHELPADPKAAAKALKKSVDELLASQKRVKLGEDFQNQILDLLQNGEKDIDPYFDVMKIAEQIPTLSGDEVLEIMDIMARAEDLPLFSKQRTAIENQAYKIVADKFNSSFMDKLTAWRYMAMLTNPTTHIRNTVGNVFFGGVTRIKNDVGALIEGGVDRANRAAGGKGIERTKSLLTRSDAELKQAAKADYEDFQALVSGGGKYNPARQIEDQKTIFTNRILDKTLSKTPKIRKFVLNENPNLLERIRKGNSNLLEWEDNLALRTRYSENLARYLKANNLDSSALTSKNLNPEVQAVVDQARLYAVEQAQKATFRDQSAIANWLSEGARKNTVSHLVIEGVVPFKKTPVNIVKRGIEYSPIGIATGVGKAFNAVKKGKYSASEAIEDIAAGLTGTGIMALGAYLMSQGFLSAAGSSDRKESGFGALRGEQNYALKLGEHSYTIDWLSPAAMPLFVGAELWQSWQQNNGEGVSFDEFVDRMTRIGDPLLEMTMLQGLNNTIQQAGYSNTNAISAIGASAVSNYFGQMVPTIGGKIASAIDPIRRRTFTQQGKNPLGIPQASQTAIRKVPFASQNLQPRIDQWGRTQENTGGGFAGRLAFNMLSPGFYSRDRSTDLDRELESLYGNTGERSILPSYAPKSFMVDGEKNILTAQEYTEYSQERGHISYQVADALRQNPAYNSLDNITKAEIISDAYSYANAIAKSKVSDYELDGWIAKAKSSPVPIDEYIIQRNRYNDLESKKDKDGKIVESASDQYRKMLLADKSLTPGEKATLDRDMTGAKNVPDYTSGDSFLLSQLTDKQQERYEKYNRGMLTAENYYEIVVAAGKGKTKAEKLERIEALGYSKQQSRQIYARILSK